MVVRMGEVSEQIERLQTLKRELKSALAYLEGCSECHAALHPACTSCDEQELDAPAVDRRRQEMAGVLDGLLQDLSS